MADKDFDAWNTKKKQTDAKKHGPDFHYRDREIWWCGVGLNVGVEIDGKSGKFSRPVLVIRRFNKAMFWGLPLTSHGQISPFLCPIMHSRTISWAVLDQLKTFSSKRLLQRIDTISDEEFWRVRESLIRLLSKNIQASSPEGEEAIGGRNLLAASHLER